MRHGCPAGETAHADGEIVFVMVKATVLADGRTMQERKLME
jgi:hypothetical protein